MADGVEELRKLVRRNIVSGADWIKVLATYYVGFPTAEPTMMNLNADELSVITEEAHAQRRKVKAHLEGEQTTKDALDTDVDIVLHGFFLDDDDVELMMKKKISLIPTLAFPGEVFRTGAPGMPEWYPKKLKAYNQVHLTSLSRAKDAGVSIAAGSDCSGGGMGGDLLRHGENAKELQYLVMNGLTPMEALVAGTRNVAEAFGVSHLIGTIEAGKLADILVVNGDPLKDVVVLQDRMRIETVIKNGDVVVRDGNSRACACPPLK
jgi:imidazolonepropionase-like amidohydrolase